MVPVSRACRVANLYPVMWFTDLRMDGSTRTERQDQEHEKLPSSLSQTPLTTSAAQSLDTSTYVTANIETITKWDGKKEINEDLVKVFQDVLQRKEYAFENRDRVTLMLLQYNRDHMVGDEQQTGRHLLKQFLASRFLWIDIDKNKKVSSGSLIESDNECQQIVDVCLARYSNLCNSISFNGTGNPAALKGVDDEMNIFNAKLAISLLESVVDTCLSIPKLKPHFLPLAESRCAHDVSHFSDYLLGINILPHEFEDDSLSPEKYYACHNSALGVYMVSLESGLRLLLKTIFRLLTSYREFTTDRGFVCDQLSVHHFRRLFELMSFHDTTSDEVESDVLDLLVEFTGLDKKSCRDYILYSDYLVGLNRMRNANGLACDMPFLTVFHGKHRPWMFWDMDKDDLSFTLTTLQQEFDNWNSSISNLCQDLLAEYGFPSWASAAEQELPETLNRVLHLVTYISEFRLATLILLTSCAVNDFETIENINWQDNAVVRGVLSKYQNDLCLFTVLKSALSLDRLLMDYDKLLCRKHTGIGWILKFKESHVFYRRPFEKMSLIAEIVGTFHDFSLLYENTINNGDAIMFERFDSVLFSLLSELSVLY